ncbi:DUF1835 domain-containing protein [Paenibacillus sp. TAB 01]|uniref:DUF1835 domain-containing protein n=1 Tax=Paenibacillus sp. TAB 01 TaxID=3368988 RepID=UPI003751C3BC
MLHIVNGDSVGDKLKQAGIQGDLFVWREVYSIGPVFSDMAGENNRSVRAHDLEHILNIPPADYISTCENQENKLQQFQKYEEIVLWFEHDLFDQTMLCYLLNWFAKQPIGKTKLSLLCIGAYPGIELFRGLGQLTPKQLEALMGTWRPIGRRELELGSKWWEAYTSPELEKHIEFLQEDMSALPFARAAFEAHLSRLPSTYNGLGMIERSTLELVASGVSSPYKLFEQAGNELNDLGMGDLEYWYHLANMSEEPYALLHVQGATDFPDFTNSVPSFRDCVITLTELGRKVLAGEKDWAEVKEMNAWYGGFRFKGHPLGWRWDASRRLVQRM